MENNQNAAAGLHHVQADLIPATVLAESKGWPKHNAARLLRTRGIQVIEINDGFSSRVRSFVLACDADKLEQRPEQRKPPIQKPSTRPPAAVRFEGRLYMLVESEDLAAQISKALNGRIHTIETA